MKNNVVVSVVYAARVLEPISFQQHAPENIEDRLKKSKPSTHEKIKESARRYLVMNGYPGLRLADIADELGITRTNVHYHFHSKEKLAEIVIEEYCAEALKIYEKIWMDRNSTYVEKVKQTIEFNRWRYLQFNPSEETWSNPWSLIDRIRNDAALVSDRARSALTSLDIVSSHVLAAVRLAQAQGEISAGAPSKSISVLLMAIIDCASAITQGKQGFVHLEMIYLAHITLVRDAYGTDRNGMVSKDR